MLLAGGLGTSKSAFELFGIPRFEVDCLVELGQLSREAERGIRNDWLTKDGQAKGDPSDWIDAITKETYGWPQHVMTYVKPALLQLHKDDAVMTASKLRAVLRAGLGRRTKYYSGRTDGFIPEELKYLTQALATTNLEGGVPRSSILEALTRHFTTDEAKEIFDNALHKGVLARFGNGYAVPIPSMQKWLIDNYLDPAAN